MKTKEYIFNTWLANNYSRLKNSISYCDMDALHDSILIAYKILKKESIYEVDFFKLIRRIYARCMRDKFYYNMVYMALEDSVLDWIMQQEGSEDEPDTRDYYGMLQNIKRQMNKRDCNIIEFYIKGLSVKDISAYTGESVMKTAKRIAHCKGFIYNSLIKIY